MFEFPGFEESMGLGQPEIFETHKLLDVLRALNPSDPAQLGGTKQVALSPLTKSLSLIALLIVTEANGDCAAVSNIFFQNHIELIYCKGQPVTEKERSHIVKIVKKVQGIAASEVDKGNRELWDLVNYIAQTCRPKILSAIEELKNFLTTEYLDDLKQKSDEIPTEEQVKILGRLELRKVLCIIDGKLQDDTTTPHINAWLRSDPQQLDFSMTMQSAAILRMFNDCSNSTTSDKLTTLIKVAYILGNQELSTFLGPAVVKKLKKVGEYLEAIFHIYTVARQSAYKYKIANMEVREVIHPADWFPTALRTGLSESTNLGSYDLNQEQRPGKECSISTSRGGLNENATPHKEITAADILLTIAQSRAVDITASEICMLFPAINCTTLKPRAADSYVHPECRLAIVLRRRYPGRFKFWIGGNDDCCLYCQPWLEFYGQSHPIIHAFRRTKQRVWFLSRFGDIVDESWQAPEDVYNGADTKTRRAIYDHIATVVRLLKNAKEAEELRSYNQAMGGGGGFTQIFIPDLI